MRDLRFLRLALVVNAAVPGALIAWDAAHDRLGANPVEHLLRSTGILALLFLALSLAVTPARKLLGIPWLGKLRRILGLTAFAYAAVHVTVYVAFEQGGDPRKVLLDALGRPFIAFGLVAFAILVPLAVTSTNGWIKRLGGRRWARLHRRVYVAALCVMAHDLLAVKADLRRPIAFGVVLGALLLYRFATHRREPLSLGLAGPPPRPTPARPRGGPPTGLGSS